MTTRQDIIKRTQPVIGKRLGKNAKRIDRRTLQFSDYLPRKVVPPPPPEVSWIMEVSDWGMLMNDSLGDCVPAAMLHMAQQWTRYAGTELVPSNNDAVGLYSMIGGYVPGDPSTDNGCDMLTALNYWRKTGISIGGKTHKIAAFVQVNPLNALHVQTAIWLFGNVFTGIQLPISAQDEDAWTVPNGGAQGDGSPGSWGGHSISIDARSPLSATCITWGQKLKMSHNFFTDYVDELYAVVSTDWVESTGNAPSGIDLKSLLIDLNAVTA